MYAAKFKRSAKELMYPACGTGCVRTCNIYPISTFIHVLYTRLRVDAGGSVGENTRMGV